MDIFYGLGMSQGHQLDHSLSFTLKTFDLIMFSLNMVDYPFPSCCPPGYFLVLNEQRGLFTL